MKKKKIFAKGFTLIEVLVVIVIIGALSAIVLSASNSARVKSQDLAIKANLDSIKTSAEFFYDKNGNYGIYHEPGDCNTDDLYLYPPIKEALDKTKLISTGTLVCKGGDATGHFLYATSWSIAIPLKSNPSIYWCIDSNGFSGEAYPNWSNDKAYCA